MHSILLTESLTKHYRNVKAVEDVNLDIRAGEIYGFLGLNGAGKTTTIRMLLGMIRPTRGKAFLFGEKVSAGNRKLWNRVGHLVEIPYSYPELTVEENLMIFSRLRLLPETRNMRDVMDLLKISRYRDVRVKNLSLGNVQRLGIAKALIHKPDLLILDEPSNGLDPEGIVEIRDLLIDLAGKHGVTIFISSHILAEISRLANRIGIIHEGRLIRETTAGHLDRSRHRALHVNTPDDQRTAAILSKLGYECHQLPVGGLELTGAEAISHPEMLAEKLAGSGIYPSKLIVQEEDLEHYFLRIIHDNP